MGHTINMKYDFDSKEAYRLSSMKDYTQADYALDIAKNAFYWDPGIGEAKFLLDSSSLTTDLFESGVTKFLDADNKPILYGSDQDDSIFGTLSRVGIDTEGNDKTRVDIGADNHPLNGWVENGIRYIGGAGDDKLVGTDYDDKLFGGDDNDVLIGLGGNDTIVGGKGNDKLYGEDGNDTYIYHAGDGFDAIVDSDGSGKIVFGGLELKGSTGLTANDWTKLSDSVWKDNLNQITYVTETQADGTTTLFIFKGSDALQVKDWSNNELGINLLS